MSDLPALIHPQDQIVVTASRGSQPFAETSASITVIDEERLQRLGEPQIASTLRLVPSAAVSTSGPAGSFTEVRIRGAEANHTLLFIDGIRANDPAESNAPRFELLNADIASRIEVIRGPQSALWGSEAIGGVIAVEGKAGRAPEGFVETGSLGSRRTSASWGVSRPTFNLSVAGAMQRSHGINNYAGAENGERDGYRNYALRGRMAWQLRPRLELGLTGFALAGRSEFDGYDPQSFARADTLDEARNSLAAGRLWASYRQQDRWNATLWLSGLRSSNRNHLDETLVNRTRARRDSAGAQIEAQFVTGAIEHRLIGAAELERESFRARDFAGGFTNQSRNRSHLGVTAEWRAELGRTFWTDVAVRKDRFNRFADATTLRASALFKPAELLELGISYAEGIAQPNFTELYGFFPDGFTGNPELRPERSRGIELTARLHRGRFGAAVSVYRQHLRDEILTVFSPVNTAINSGEKSKRSGAEAEIRWRHSDAANLSLTYAYLDARQPSGVGEASPELRRPRHSGSIAVDGATGRWSYGASLAYAGARRDQRDEFPYELVRLDPYWLAGARVAYDVTRAVQLFARAANAFDDHYQDVVNYRTEGRSLYVGIRLTAGG